MYEFLAKLFSSDFMPHGHCFLWKPEIVWLHVISDLVIAVSYFTIPLALLKYWRRGRDLSFSWIYVLFAVFIFACGATHLMSIWNVWHGAYRIEGVIKLITAIASISTAFLLWGIIPEVLKIPSPSTLQDLNEKLRDEALEKDKTSAFLDSVINNVPLMIFVKDAKNLSFVRINIAGQKLLGLKSEELLGKTDYDFFPKEQADFFTTKDRTVLESFAYLEIFGEEIETKNRGKRFLRTKKIALRDKDGQPTFLLGISEDITEERRLREDLGLAHEELEKKVTERTQELSLANEELSQRLIQLTEAEERFRVAVESSPEGVVVTDVSGKITLVNQEIEMLFGYPRAELLGQSLEILVPKSSNKDNHDYPSWSFTKAEAFPNGVNQELIAIRKDGSEFPVEVGLNPITTSKGRFILSTIVDITERRQVQEITRRSLAQKELLLKEIHHRVKNNMQVISSLLRIQANYFTEEKIHLAFRECQDRVRSMALVHEKLYVSEELSHVQFKTYIENLVSELCHSYFVGKGDLKLDLDIQQTELSISTAIPCGLILNELITNALKHAFINSFEDQKRLSISVHKLEHEQQGLLELVVKDNGIGFPTVIDPDSPDTMGLTIVKTLCQQLRGTMNISTKNGTSFCIRFNATEYK